MIRLAVVGLGKMGLSHQSMVNAHPGIELKAVCDTSGYILDVLSKYTGVKTYSDYKQMLAEEPLDCVFVATPSKYHTDIVAQALERGLHVFCEKPFGLDPETGFRMADIAERKGLVLMVDHTFLYSAPVRKIVEIVQAGDLGEIRYINSRRLNLGLFQKDINVAWDLAPHDISIILHILGEFPVVVNCQGNAHVTPQVEDVTNMSLLFPHKRFATIQSSWLEPRKIREMTIVGSRRMIVYDDLQTREKIRIYDVRVERPPHYDTFAEFHYSYHYGDSYIPHLQQEEPLALACRHFIECIETNSAPITGGRQGLELIRVLEGASASLKMNGAPFMFGSPNGSARPPVPIRNGSAHSPKSKRTGRKVSRARNGVANLFENA